jgi:hypothetical protein
VIDAGLGRRSQLDFLAPSGHANHILDFQAFAVQYYSHAITSVKN